jgi:hypothetical protein
VQTGVAARPIEAAHREGVPDTNQRQDPHLGHLHAGRPRHRRPGRLAPADVGVVGGGGKLHEPSAPPRWKTALAESKARAAIVGQTHQRLRPRAARGSAGAHELRKHLGHPVVPDRLSAGSEGVELDGFGQIARRARARLEGEGPHRALAEPSELVQRRDRRCHPSPGLEGTMKQLQAPSIWPGVVEHPGHRRARADPMLDEPCAREWQTKR